MMANTTAAHRQPAATWGIAARSQGALPFIALALRSLFTAALFALACARPSAAGGAPQDPELLAIPPELRHLNFVWARAEGDLNGDAIPDLVLLLTGSKNEGPREERLVVLAGQADGRYKLISVSGEFCHPDKFYNLEIRKNSVFAEAVGHADSSRFSGFTLQFRYSAARQDLELIGEEISEENYVENSLSKTSFNRLTQTVVHTRKVGKRVKEARGRLAAAAVLSPLRGFDCGNHVLSDSPVYIDEDFRVHRKQLSSQ